MASFFYQHVKPLAQISGNHVHQSKSANDLVPVQLHVLQDIRCSLNSWQFSLGLYLVVQKNELNLEQSQQHPGDRSDGLKTAGVAVCHAFELKVATKFQAGVHHAANTKSCKFPTSSKKTTLSNTGNAFFHSRSRLTPTNGS